MLRDILVLTGAALLVRTGVAILVPAPPWTDSAYYYVSAQQIASGNGLTVPFIWSFLETGGALPDNPALPIASHAHWMPLTAFVTALPMLVAGPEWRVAQIPMVFLSTLMTPLTYLTALNLWGSRAAAISGAIVILFCGPLLLFGSIVENFAVFGLPSLGALYAAMRAARGARGATWWLAASGALVGVATLARIEGVMLSVAPAAAWLIGMTAGGRRGRLAARGWLAGFACLAAFTAVVTPWALRNLATFGAILPSTGGHTLWIKSYNEQFSITADTSFSAYLAQGLLPIIASKLATWGVLLGYVMVVLGIFAFTLIGAIVVRRRDPAVTTFLTYFVVMLALMGGIFTFHAPRGLFLHHASAWLPIAAPLGILGITPTATAVSRWWPFLARAATHRFLLVVGILASITISVVTSAILLRAWREDIAAMETVGSFLAAYADPEDVIIHRDAPLLTAITGFQAVAPPADPYPVIEEVVRAYGADWVVVQRQTQGSRVEPLGLWEGASSVDKDGNRADWLASTPSLATESIRVYAVVGQ